MDDIWKEIAALQNQLSQTQKTDFGPRLSERNCVDIVQRLLRMKLIDLVFSSDGREYITPTRLQRDILAEVELHGGRIDIEQLAEQLNLDVDVLKRSGEQLTKQHENIRFVLHEIISDTYLRRVAEQINEQLDMHGIITSAHLCKQFNLPSHIPELIFSKFLGIIIHAQRATSDKTKLFTKDAVNRHRCMWRGMLSACTRPCSLQALLQNNPDLDRGLSFQVIEELISSGSVKGTLSSSRFETAIYTPAVLADARRSYVTKSLHDNGFVEYDRVKRQLDVADAKSFIRKALESERGGGDAAESVVFFQTCAVNISLIHNVESYVQEAIASEGYADLAQSGLCPSSFSGEDYRELIRHCKTYAANDNRQHKDWCSLSDDLLLSQQLITNYANSITALVQEEARQVADELIKLPVVRKAVLLASSEPVAEAVESLRTAATALQQNNDGSQQSMDGSSSGVKQQARSVTALRDQTLNIMQRLKAFEKGADLFTSNTDTRDQLRKHLARVVGAELLSTLLMYCEAADLIKTSVHKASKSGDRSMQFDKPEERRKAIDQLPTSMRQSFVDLNDACNKGNLDGFNEKLDDCVQHQDLGLVLRKKDRKSDRALLVEYTHELKQQLEKCTDDLTAVLHLVVLILVSSLSRQCLHASGKFVPAIIKEYLTDKIAVAASTGEEGGEDVEFLKTCLQHVIDQVKSKSSVMPDDEKQMTIEKCKALVKKYEKTVEG